MFSENSSTLLRHFISFDSVVMALGASVSRKHTDDKRRVYIDSMTMNHTLLRNDNSNLRYKPVSEQSSPFRGNELQVRVPDRVVVKGSFQVALVGQGVVDVVEQLSRVRSRICHGGWLASENKQ